MFCFAVQQVTTFQNIEGMLEKVHLVTEGTLIYLRETSDVFIRVQNGWRKLQVLLHYVLSFPALLLKTELWIFLQGWRSMYAKIILFFFLSQQLLLVWFSLFFLLCFLAK